MHLTQRHKLVLKRVALVGGVITLQMILPEGAWAKAAEGDLSAQITKVQTTLGSIMQVGLWAGVGYTGIRTLIAGQPGMAGVIAVSAFLIQTVADWVLSTSGAVI